MLSELNRKRCEAEIRMKSDTNLKEIESNIKNELQENTINEKPERKELLEDMAVLVLNEIERRNKLNRWLNVP